MKNTNKKGFTIVELVIVIAIVAILAAILIPTFAGLVQKANESSDIQAVKQMNTILATAVEPPQSVVEAAKLLSENGFNTERGLTPTYTNHAYYWFKLTNQVVYVNEAEGAFTLVFPENVEGFPTEKTNDCVPLANAIQAVVSVPTVSATTATVNADEFNASHNAVLPDSVTDFNSLMVWLTDGEDKHLQCTIDGGQKSGVIFPDGDIKLTEDIIIDTTNAVSGVGNTLCLNIVENTTIDLNGHSIIQHGSGLSLSLFAVRDGATLNIVDSSAGQTGTIEVSHTAFQVSAGGTLNIFSGTIKCSDTRSEVDIDDGLTLITMNGGTLNVFGGTIDAASGGNPEIDHAIFGYGTSTDVCNLYGGALIGWIDDTSFDTFNNYGATGEYYLYSEDE